MSKTYSSKYFSSRLKKIRLTISRIEGYKTVDELIIEHKKAFKLSNVNQHQGNEK